MERALNVRFSYYVPLCRYKFFGWRNSRKGSFLTRKRAGIQRRTNGIGWGGMMEEEEEKAYIITPSPSDD